DVISFKKLNSDKRTKLIKENKCIIDAKRPDLDDSAIYKTWFHYYEYLYLQRKAEDNWENEHWKEGIRYAQVALDILATVLELSKGRFNRIYIKAQYQKRGMEFIKNSIEIRLQEKEIQQVGGLERKTNKSGNQNSSFRAILNWWEDELLPKIK
ncbi:MAG: hypothetical protein ACI86H_001189, partial [bacterium]